MPEPEYTLAPNGEKIPTPPPHGATDYGLGGVEVPIEEMDEEERAFVERLSAAAAALPMWTAFFSFLTSLVSKFPPGRKRENVNNYTFWFYASWNIAAAWCFIIISWVLNHFGMLDQIGGKRAWVPDLKKVPGHKSGASGLAAGHIVAIDEYGHIGICTYRSGSTFHMWSGNSTTTGSSDGTTVKSYNTSIASGNAPLKFAPATPVDPNAYPGAIYKYTKGKPLMGGSHVKWIQQRLAAHKHAVSIDSQYGPKTAAAVKAFQTDSKLTADGQVGSKTWSALAK
jgi:Putative peptidoglycan binding domain